MQFSGAQKLGEVQTLSMGSTSKAKASHVAESSMVVPTSVNRKCDAMSLEDETWLRSKL